MLTWRLPSGSSTPRVTAWRTLRRIGAVLLTPGAAVVPYTEDLLEQCDWTAQRISEAGGEAWVLPVTQLSAREEAVVRERQRAQREREYAELGHLADAVTARHGRTPRRKIAALERCYRSVVARDHFHAGGRQRARRAIERALKQDE